jgi:hypothetical protein
VSAGGPSLDGTIITLGIFIAGNIGSLIWGAATVRAQLSGMQREIERQGQVLQGLADVRGEMKLMMERAMMQGRRIDELTSLVMSHLIGERAASEIDKLRTHKE